MHVLEAENDLDAELDGVREMLAVSDAENELDADTEGEGLSEGGSGHPLQSCTLLLKSTPESEPSQQSENPELSKPTQLHPLTPRYSLTGLEGPPIAVSKVHAVGYTPPPNTGAQIW